MSGKISLVLLSVGIALFVLGFFLTFFWMQYPPLKQDSYVVKAGATLELSWYLYKGERTEGGFTVSGGNEEASLSIKNPSGETIYNWYAKGRSDNGFTAQDSGMYTMVFKNLDTVNDESIGVNFLSPYEPRFFTIYDEAGLLMMLMGSGVIVFLGIRALRNG
jgi:heme/copper-type cytochrome/quinol oxidase subunit 1